MRVSRQERRTDWPKLGPSILIGTALIVAIRTAKWAAKSNGDRWFQIPMLSWMGKAVSPRALASGSCMSY
jgi:hypothetical protein